MLNVFNIGPKSGQQIIFIKIKTETKNSIFVEKKLHSNFFNCSISETNFHFKEQYYLFLNDIYLFIFHHYKIQKSPPTDQSEPSICCNI